MPPPKPFGHRPSVRQANESTYAREGRLQREARIRCGLPPERSPRDLLPWRFPLYVFSDLLHPIGRKRSAFVFLSSLVLAHFTVGKKEDKKEKGPVEIEKGIEVEGGFAAQEEGKPKPFGYRSQEHFRQRRAQEFARKWAPGSAGKWTKGDTATVAIILIAWEVVERYVVGKERESKQAESQKQKTTEAIQESRRPG